MRASRKAFRCFDVRSNMEAANNDEEQSYLLKLPVRVA